MTIDVEAFVEFESAGFRPRLRPTTGTSAISPASSPIRSWMRRA